MNVKQKIWTCIQKLFSLSSVILLTGCLVQSVYQLPHTEDPRMPGVWKAVWSRDKGDAKDTADNVFVVKHVGDVYQFGTNAPMASHNNGTNWVIVSRINNVLFAQMPVKTSCAPSQEPNEGCYAVARIDFSSDKALVYSLDPRRLANAAQYSPLGVDYAFIPGGPKSEPQIVLKGQPSALASFLRSLVGNPNNFILEFSLQKID